MPFSRNPRTGRIEAYTDNGFLTGFISTMGDFITNNTANDGGPGSGNFNHEGRPGLVGGSGPGGGSASGPDPSPKTIKIKLTPEEPGKKEAYERARTTGFEQGKQFGFFANYLDGVRYGGGATHDAAQAYSFHYDVFMNNLLRGGEPWSYEQQEEWNKNIDKTKEWINTLTEAMDKNPLRKPGVVYRGVDSARGFAKMLGLGNLSKAEVDNLISDPDFANSLVGQTFSDPAFTSTTIDEDFLVKRSGKVGPCELEIYCPEGTKGLYFGDQTRFTDEHEYLLQRGTQFTITEVERIEKHPGWEPKEYYLKMQVTISNQVPKEIPEGHNNVFPEPRDEIRSIVGTDKILKNEELSKMFPGADPNVLNELNSIRSSERNIETYDRIWELVNLQRELGYIDDTEAAELESYSMNLDRFKDQDSYRRKSEEQEKDLQKIADGEFEDQERYEKEIRERYPDASEKLIPLMITYEASKEHTENSLKRDIERYGDEGSITKSKRRSIEADKRCLEYIAKQRR